MPYNIWFEVSATIFLVVLLIYLILQYDLRIARNRGFLALVIITEAGNVLDVVSALAINHISQVPPAANLFLNTIYYAVLGMIGASFTRYSYIIAPASDRKKSSYIRIISDVMFAAYIVFILINIPTGIIASFTRTAYIHGPLYMLIFVYPYLMVALSFIRMLMYAEELKDRKKKALMIFYFVFCFGMSFVQLVLFPHVLLALYAIAIGMIFVLMLMETPDYQSLRLSMQRTIEAEKNEAAVSARLRRSLDDKDMEIRLLKNRLKDAEKEPEKEAVPTLGTIQEKQNNKPHGKEKKAVLCIDDSDEFEKLILTQVLSDEYSIVYDGRADICITDITEKIDTGTPVIYLSDGNNGNEAVKRGADEVVLRPVVMSLLRRRINAVLTEKEETV